MKRSGHPWRTGESRFHTGLLMGGVGKGGGGVVGHCLSVMHGFAAVNTS